MKSLKRLYLLLIATAMIACSAPLEVTFESMGGEANIKKIKLKELDI